MNEDRNQGFQKLWAPWRMKYINQVTAGGETGCIFCAKPEDHDDEKNFILHRGKTCFVIMNIYPYNNGHVMVVPYLHTSSFKDLDAETRLEIMDVIDMFIEIIKSVMKPDGFNIGMNLGRTAGAGIDDHLHMHIVPRWNGDTNFMPVIGCAKIISESLEDTYAKLKKALEQYVKKE